MGLEPVCHVCSPQSCDIFEKCKGKEILTEGMIAGAVARELDVRQVRAEVCQNPWKRVIMLHEVVTLRRLVGLEVKNESLEGSFHSSSGSGSVSNTLNASRGSLTTWHIRYEGCPSNPRFRRRKRRTASFVGDLEGAKQYARSLKQGQDVKVLWIRPKERTAADFHGSF